MLDSRGEIKIHEILEENGINFIEEYSFPDLLSSNGKLLRFDFAIFDDDGNLEFLIEFQGVQHYEPRSYFGGMSGLRQQQYNDTKKRNYCRAHDYVLLEIPYYDEYKVNYDYIMERAYGWK